MHAMHGLDGAVVKNLSLRISQGLCVEFSRLEGYLYAKLKDRILTNVNCKDTHFSGFQPEIPFNAPGF